MVLVCVFIWKIIETPEDPDFDIDPFLQTDSRQDDSPISEEPSLKADDSTFEDRSERIQVDTGKVTGTVVDGATELPIPRFYLGLIVEESGNWNEKLNEKVENADGRFTIPVLPGQRFHLLVQAQGYSKYKETLTGNGSELLITLDKLGSRLGQVVESSTGQPVQDAYVVAARDSVQNRLNYESSADTDADGRFVLPGLRDVPYRITVSHLQYESASIISDSPEKEMLIQIKKIPQFKVHGIVTDDWGRPASGIDIKLTTGHMDYKAYARTDRTGRYQIVGVTPGYYLIEAALSDDLSWDDTLLPCDFSEEKKKIHVRDKDVKVDFGHASKHIRWTGTVFDIQRKPVQGGRLRIHAITPDSISEIDETEYSVTCTEQGSFVINKLLPGAYRVFLDYADEINWSRWYRNYAGYEGYTNYFWDVVINDSPKRLQRNLNISGGVIRGVVIDDNMRNNIRNITDYIVSAILGSDKRRIYSRKVDIDGRFSLEGLPPGNYVINAAELHGTEYGIQDYIDNIYLAKDQVIDNLRIILPVCGHVKVFLLYPQSLQDSDLEVHFHCIDGGKHFFFGRQKLTNRKSWNDTYCLQTGQWKLRLIGENTATVEREFSINENATTELNIDLHKKTSPKNHKIRPSGE